MRETSALWMRLAIRQSAMLVGLSAVLGGLGAGCADASPESDECTLPAEPEFEITNVELQADLSNSDCPSLDGATLDAQLLNEEVCEQRVEECSVVLDCEAESITVNGKLYEKEARLRGRIDVRTPLVCVYFVTAEFQ